MVLTTARSSATRKTAASSKGAKPTSSSEPSRSASSLTSSVTRSPNLAAQPPHDVHSVSRNGEVAGWSTR